MENKKTTVVIPMYNAEKTILKVLLDIEKTNSVEEIILVDDFSTDNTCDIVGNYIKNSTNKNTVYKLIKHNKNTGYGGNQKTCYKEALKSGADIVIMIHGDYQYDPSIIPIIKNYILERNFDVVLGSRIRSKFEALSSGMPYYKYISNRFLSSLENFITSYTISDWHTGMRAYKRKSLENIDYSKFSDDFIFDTQILLSLIKKKQKLSEVHIPVRYLSDSSSINFLRSLKYGLLTLKELLIFLIK
jgi:glycosyltransferase involved in cell wall biosynthesis